MYGEFREMINLQKKQEIILLHVRENYSRRKIAKQLGLDRATVGKYIDEYEEKKREKLLQEDMEVDTGELIQSILLKSRSTKLVHEKTKVNR
jgi:predicted transcriptional regulator